MDSKKETVDVKGQGNDNEVLVTLYQTDRTEFLQGAPTLIIAKGANLVTITDQGQPGGFYSLAQNDQFAKDDTFEHSFEIPVAGKYSIVTTGVENNNNGWMAFHIDNEVKSKQDWYAAKRSWMKKELQIDLAKGKHVWKGVVFDKNQDSKGYASVFTSFTISPIGPLQVTLYQTDNKDFLKGTEPTLTIAKGSNLKTIAASDQEGGFFSHAWDQKFNINDAFEHKLEVVKTGKYLVTALGVTNANHGKVTFTFGGTKAFTTDWYSAKQINSVKQQWNVDLAKGKFVFRGEVTDKSGNSTGYSSVFTSFTIQSA
jgi:hypothetical protein